MRVGGLTSTTVLMKGYDGAAWRNLLADPRGVLPTLSLPRPLPMAPGRLIGYDDLEGVLKWSQVTGTVSRDNTIHVANGDYCLKLLTGAVAGNEATAMRFFPVLTAGKVRFMCLWHTYQASDATLGYQKPRSVRFRLDIYDGAKMYQPQLEYLNFLNTVQQERWRYNNAAGAFTDVPGGSQHLHMGENDEAYPAHNFLLVDVEIAAGACTIKRIMSNNLDLTGLSLGAYVDDSSHGPDIGVYFHAYTDVAAAVSAYFDDVLVGDLAQP